MKNLRYIQTAFLSLVVMEMAACATAISVPSTSTPLPRASNTPPATTVPSPSVLPSPTVQSTIQISQTTLPVFDGHIHFSQDIWARFPVSTVVRMFDQAGIKRALVSSTPNEGTVRLHQADPLRFTPELRPYRTRDDMNDWFSNPQIVAMIEEELRRGIYRGIGEFHLDGNEAKTPQVQRIVDLAVERGLPLHAHSDEIAIENLFAVNPKVRIMWAHTGFTTSTARIAQLFDRYPNLWSELSYRSDIVENGKPSSEWRALFLRFPDRFVYGSDTWIESRWDQLPTLVKSARGWLADLPPAVAEKIAYRNFELLYGK